MTTNKKENDDTFYLIERYRKIEEKDGTVWWDYYPRSRIRNTLDEALFFAEEQKKMFTSFVYKCKKIAKVEYVETNKKDVDPLV